MGHAWIVGVLDDLRTYAELNGLDRLARRLAEATAVAEGETGGTPAWALVHGTRPRVGLDRGGAQPR